MTIDKFLKKSYANYVHDVTNLYIHIVNMVMIELILLVKFYKLQVTITIDNVNMNSFM